jgi:hypothetical protein
MSKTVQEIPAQEHAGMTEEVHVWMTTFISVIPATEPVSP